MTRRKTRLTPLTGGPKPSSFVCILITVGQENIWRDWVLLIQPTVNVAVRSKLWAKKTSEEIGSCWFSPLWMWLRSKLWAKKTSEEIGSCWFSPLWMWLWGANCGLRKQVTLPDARSHRVSAGTGRPSASILWLGEIGSLTYNFYVSGAVRTFCLSTSGHGLSINSWQAQDLSKSNGEVNVGSKATRQDTTLRNREKNEDNWHYRIHTETKVEMGQRYSKNEGQ